MLITGLYAGLAGMFLVFLSIRVVGHRRSKKISVGASGDAEMERAMRTQANFVEYTPLALIMLGVSELNGLPAFGVHLLGGAWIVARIAHFIGFSSVSGPMMFRVAGTAATFSLLLILALVVIAQFFGLFTAV